MKTKVARPVSLLILVTIFMCAAYRPSVHVASVEAAAQEQATRQSTGPTEPHELEAFLDDLLPALMEEHHIPGTTLSVVRDGELFFAKGYGFADLETQRPVIADRTVFHIGSTSKLFTWTAVMQLVEQGKLNLNADVNTYLKDFQISATYDQPITLAHLMTHTAGFEERNERMFVNDVELMMSHSDYLAHYMPARIYAPGERVAYSNYGTSLAAHIVQEVSGLTFEQYIQENIFTPLEMIRTTFRQPLPPELAGEQAVSYQYNDGDYERLPAWYIQAFPAGAGSTTAIDMANFMIAHLQDGRYRDVRLLQASTAQDMHRQHYLGIPRVSGMTYGFPEKQVNGYHFIGHAGGFPGVAAGFDLLPEHNMGLFVAFNASGGEMARDILLQTFMDRYYPESATSVPQPKPDFANRAVRFVGIYQNSRHNESTFEKLAYTYGGSPYVMSIELTSDNRLETGGYEWVETEDPLVLIRQDGHEHLIFQEDKAGNITSFMFQNMPIHFYSKISWFESATFSTIWGGIGLLFFLLTVLIWPLKALTRRLRRNGGTGDAVPLLGRIGRWLAWGLSVLSLFFFVMFMFLLFSGVLVQEGQDAAAGLFLIPLVAVLLAIGMFIITGLAWWRRYWTLSGRLYYTMLTMAAVLFLSWLNYWNLISLPG